MEGLSPALLPSLTVLAVDTLTCSLSFSSTGPGSAAAVQLLCPKGGDSEPVNFAVWLPVAVLKGLSSDHDRGLCPQEWMCYGH